MPVDDLHVVNIQCSCGSFNHIARFSLDTSDKKSDPYLNLEIMLNPTLSFWKRVKNAIWYICNPTDTKFCHYDDVVLAHEDVVKLQRQFNLYSILHRFRVHGRATKNGES